MNATTTDHRTPDHLVEVVDSHLHLWDPARLDYPWLAQVPSLHRSYLPADLQVATTGLDQTGFRLEAAVFVEAGRTDRHADAEVDWVEQLAAEWPVLRAVVAHAPLERGGGAAAQVAALGRRRLVTGVRRNIQDEAPGFSVCDDFVDGVRLLAANGLCFDLCVRHHQLAEVTLLVARVPQVTFVLDHVGKPPVAAGPTGSWRDDLSRLADLPNVVCKLSGLATESTPGWVGADLLPYLEHALRRFGADRCLFGGDWPVATLATGYRRWLGIVHTACAGLPAAQRRAVFADTARRVYRLSC
ncbi:amidohydrolase family protein [Solwaraspora sp. WMMD791]|uniref:amidohydrolase family protein n=1 Tax=Solwaraspora sp. WMMD791 TaxID=3016086 RepID=UPI00249A0DE2|nr:amidohydrolase family protein [Solwaraspora sp. WMMD791]WFE28033.1 amidohydrolase family protein [Solwaraspora sp. WMMD791]